MTDENQDPDGDVLDPKIREHMRKLEDENKAKDAQIAAMQRDQAFADAGVPKDGAGALLRRAYEGDLTSEAIQAQAKEFGLTFGSQTEQQQQEADAAAQAELDAQRRVAGANVGAGTPTARANVLSELASLGSETEVIDFVKQVVREGRDPGGVFGG